MMQNAQWQVTDYGVESIKGHETPEYHFAAERLAETTYRGDGTCYNWPVHMAEKPWVDVEAFLEAFKAALGIHIGKYPGPIDAGMLRASCEKARKIALGTC